MKRKGWHRKKRSKLELARAEFLNACVAELERHAVKFRTIKAVGVPCGEVIAYAEKRYYFIGYIPTPWNVLRSFERRMRLTLSKMERKMRANRRKR